SACIINELVEHDSRVRADGELGFIEKLNLRTRAGAGHDDFVLVNGGACRQGLFALTAFKQNLVLDRYSFANIWGGSLTLPGKHLHDGERAREVSQQLNRLSYYELQPFSRARKETIIIGGRTEMSTGMRLSLLVTICPF